MHHHQQQASPTLLSAGRDATAFVEHAQRNAEESPHKLTGLSSHATAMIVGGLSRVADAVQPSIVMSANVVSGPWDLLVQAQLQCSLQFVFHLVRYHLVRYTEDTDVGDWLANHLRTDAEKVLQGIDALRTAKLRTAVDELKPILSKFIYAAGAYQSADLHSLKLGNLSMEARHCVNLAHEAFNTVSSAAERITAAKCACCAFGVIAFVDAVLGHDLAIVHEDLKAEVEKLFRLDRVRCDCIVQMGLAWRSIDLSSNAPPKLDRIVAIGARVLSVASNREARLRDIVRLWMHVQMHAISSGLQPAMAHDIIYTTLTKRWLEGGSGAYQTVGISLGCIVGSGIFSGAKSLGELKQFLTPWELRVLGYGCIECRQAGLSPKQLESAGYKSSHPFLAGSTSWPSPYALRDSGVAAVCSASFLKSIGYTANDLVTMGYSTIDVRLADFSVAECRTSGLTPSQLQDAGYDIHVDFLHGGWPDDQQLKTSADCISALVESHSRLLKAEIAGLLKTAGYTAQELKSLGLTALQCKHLGFSASDLFPHCKRTYEYTVGAQVITTGDQRHGHKYCTRHPADGFRRSGGCRDCKPRWSNCKFGFVDKLGDRWAMVHIKYDDEAFTQVRRCSCGALLEVFRHTDKEPTALCLWAE